MSEMSDPNERPRSAAEDDDDLVVDWDDFEDMGKRVLTLPPQPEDD